MNLGCSREQLSIGYRLIMSSREKMATDFDESLFGPFRVRAFSRYSCNDSEPPART